MAKPRQKMAVKRDSKRKNLQHQVEVIRYRVRGGFSAAQKKRRHLGVAVKRKSK